MSNLPAAQIPDTEVREIKSNHTEQEYRISVALPYEYHDLPAKKYQTVYILL